MTADLYQRPRRLSWAEEIDAVAAVLAVDLPPLATPPPAPEPRRRAPRGEWKPVPVPVPSRRPSIAELEARLVAAGITGLTAKPPVTCPECEAIAPNHRVDCKQILMPDPGRPVCSCGYPAGSLGCCGRAA